MKKALNLFIILLFSLTLSQQTSGAVKDKGLVKLQSWLKGLGQKYSIQKLKTLKELDLSRKDLKELSPTIGNLKALTHLDLKGNQLKILPKELGNLKALTTLSLHNNPLSDKEKEKIKKLLPECEIRF